ncbi:T9SS type A sorting domain-containing protein [Neptunitalea lumnitzerae]|uniref:Secretion system C-terminal sorting domain-containing protein n=1 Tax=Neptunitalea lumnitzerae TaxID=2965509 RepID=A0ABQ5MHR3_9FLAO|nr:T9SS type A sorting domain-containing protein [Neptunitalea sp. Y10]GLB48932.1 hypothetical protein Y10_13000 [Neptunitalea sp. Y10]
MIKNYVLLLCVICVYTLNAQTENWYFGEYAGISFDPTTHAFSGALTNGQLNTTEGSACISDGAGNILFYTDGTDVYNAQNNIMVNGTGLLGDNSSTQSALIVPFVNAPTKYYIFTIDDASGPLAYSVVDMTLDNGNGAIVATQKNIVLLNNTSEKLCATHSANGGYWVITFAQNNSNTYELLKAFEITSSGVNTTSVDSYVNSNSPDARGYLKISPDGSKIAIATNDQDNLFLCDFNTTTGMVNTAIQLEINYTADLLYGIEFSPNSNVLYAHSYNSTQDSALVQFDLTATDIEASQLIIDQVTGTGGYRGALQLAEDGRIYRTTPVSYAIGTNYLSVIENPNVIGTGCNYVQDAIYLGSNKEAMQGLPNFIASYFDPAFLSTDSVSQNLDITMYLNKYTEVLTIENNTLKSIESISVFTLTGQTILDDTNISNNSTYTVNTSNFAPGIYLINVTADNQTITKKIIID